MKTYSTSLYDEKTFYKAFIKDLEQCQSEVIIESPFMTADRMKMLRPILNKLYNGGIKVFIITRDLREHNEGYEEQSENEIEALESLGIQVLLCTGNQHRKLAIIDRQILWEGSLNILSKSKAGKLCVALKATASPQICLIS